MKTYLQRKFNKSLYNSAYSRAFYTLIGTVITEMACSFKQFYSSRFPVRSFLNVIAIISSSLFRLFLGRSLKYSFAFTGEDRIIEGIIKPIIDKPGFYVEVGCNHPKFFSNTYGLYKKGWKGICIDANEKLIKKYSFYRPRDIAICALISDQVTALDYYEVENNVLSTVEDTNIKGIQALGLSYQTIKRTTSTLTAILQQYHVEKYFDILSIDAEEHDFQVLCSLDFSKFRPKLIIVEDEDFDFTNYSYNRFVVFLKDKSYKMVGYVLKNAYFLREDFSVL